MGAYITAVHRMRARKVSSPGSLQRRSKHRHKTESCHQTEIKREPAARLDKTEAILFRLQNQAARLKFSFHHALSVTLGKIMSLPGH